jgi:hypothetical protein
VGGGGFCDVAKVTIIQKTFSQNLAIYPDMQVFKKKRVLLYSWLPTETYHKNIWKFYFILGNEFGPFLSHEKSFI